MKWMTNLELMKLRPLQKKEDLDIHITEQDFTLQNFCYLLSYSYLKLSILVASGDLKTKAAQKRCTLTLPFSIGVSLSLSLLPSSIS